MTLRMKWNFWKENWPSCFREINVCCADVLEMDKQGLFIDFPRIVNKLIHIEASRNSNFPRNLMASSHHHLPLCILLGRLNMARITHLNSYVIIGIQHNINVVDRIKLMVAIVCVRFVWNNNRKSVTMLFRHIRLVTLWPKDTANNTLFRTEW